MRDGYKEEAYHFIPPLFVGPIWYCVKSLNRLKSSLIEKLLCLSVTHTLKYLLISEKLKSTF